MQTTTREARLIEEQLANDEPRLDRLAEADFVRENEPHDRIVEDSGEDIDLMVKRFH